MSAMWHLKLGILDCFGGEGIFEADWEWDMGKYAWADSGTDCGIWSIKKYNYLWSNIVGGEIFEKGLLFRFLIYLIGIG